MHVIFEHITNVKEKSWAWFVARAQGPYGIFWLCLLSYLEPFISPIVPEALMAAMILAAREKWKLYMALTTAFTFLGGITGYFIGFFVFKGFGDVLLRFTGYGEIHDASQMLLGGNIFLIMFFIAFTLLPDKPFTYLAGFLGLPFFHYAAGLLVGRSMRIALVGYFTYKFGPQILAVVNRYFFWFALVVLAIFGVYAIVQADALWSALRL